MKALVIGGGSIGKRHLQNLRELGVRGIALVESDTKRRKILTDELTIPGFSRLDDGLDWSPDFAVVATPTHLHAEQALQIVRCSLNLFVEKPLCHRVSGLHELSELVEQKGLISLVGCNMRFHPGPAKVKELLQQNRLGKVLFARVHSGSYLPTWRPDSDYRVNYAASEETGGGCILDCIHEIDLARWYLGEVSEVFCIADHTSSLEINTEDVATLVCRHISGSLSEIHLDYVQRTYERGCQIVGELGSIFWDFNQRQVRWYDATSDQWTAYDQPADWQLNQMYLDEMRHFLDSVRDHRPTSLSIPEAVAVMHIAFAAKESSRKGVLVSTEKEVAA
jgi:predicted dehydrogenase